MNSELSIKSLNIINETLRKIGKGSEYHISTPESAERKVFIDLINKHNTFKGYMKSENAVKNSVVSRIKQIISAPSNQMIANAPVDIED